MRAAMRPSRAALVLTLVVGLAACRSSSTPRELRKTRLATVPPTYRKGTIAIADDGAHWAMVVRDAEGQHVAADDGRGTAYKECGTPRFAPGSERLFYWAVDGASTPPRVVLVSGDRVLATDYVRLPALVFSKGGTRWASVGGTASAEGGGPVAVLVDGREMGRHADASLPAFSPDGQHVAYLIQDEAGQIRLLVDGNEQRAFKGPETPTSPIVKTLAVGPNLPPQFSVNYLRDGSLLVLTQDRDGWAIYHDTVRLGSYPSSVWSGHGPVALDLGPQFRTAVAIAPASLSVADAGPVAAWWIRREGEVDTWRVVRNGRPVGATLCSKPWTAPPVLSGDGAHVAYVCVQSAPGAVDTMYVVHDELSYGPYLDVFGIALSPDGAHVAYAASVVRDATDLLPHQPWNFHVDGRPFEHRYTSVWRPRFTADGAHLAWEAEAEGRNVLGLDDHEVATFDEVVWGPTVSRVGEVFWVVRKGRRLARLDLATPATGPFSPPSP
jgi:hypothetical protein